MLKKNKITFYIISLLIFIVASISVIYSIFFLPNVLVSKKIYIKSGNTYKEILQQLKVDKVLKCRSTFDIAMRILMIDKKIIRGAYSLQQGDTNLKIGLMLKKGLQKPVNFTISAAADKYDFIKQVCTKLNIDYEKFTLLLADNSFLQEFGFNSENVLTMFIPNTYEVYWTISEKDFFKKMYLEYSLFWTSARLGKAANLGLSTIETSILASIVQMETNLLAEAYKISGVYLNRLKKRIPLYADPTIKYAMLRAQQNECLIIKRILKKDTNIKSPYNTYRVVGLPPGPICLPSIAYIDAVLDSEKHGCFYFSGKEDFSGTHYFSKSLQEHNKNARKYRRQLNKKGILR